ncbi:MAG: hypothetical protein QM730_05940 [Anaerolineales bacterium]
MNSNIEIKSQPFGGAVRILDVDAIHDLLGDFHFDSERSRAEQDFRLFIRPAAWSTLREFCLRHIIHDDDPILETSPERELVEEFYDTLKVDLKPEQYTCKPVATLDENEASVTENVHAKGYPTVRVYRIFEVLITDTFLANVMLKESERVSNDTLHSLALENIQNGGRGWANAILTLPLKQVTDAYRSVSPAQRNFPIRFENNLLDETVSAVLEGVAAPKYQILGPLSEKGHLASEGSLQSRTLRSQRTLPQSDMCFRLYLTTLIVTTSLFTTSLFTPTPSTQN